MLVKISHIYAGLKQLTARVEAHSLLISALVRAMSVITPANRTIHI